VSVLLALAALWVLLGALWLAVYPFLERTRPPLPLGLLELQDLEAEKARLLGELHDLELDWQTGKLSEDDYRAIEARLKSRAVAVMAEIEERTRVAGDRPPAAATADRSS
jgi:hypothetical protein